MAEVFVFDSEMVSALADSRSKKHRTAMVAAKADMTWSKRSVLLVVPSTVRVEAGWDRTAPRWARVNRLRIVDHHLDRASTDVAARLRAEHGVSPADAHIGAIAAEAGDDRVVVITSDPDDMAAVTAGTGARIVRL
jgi:predicted nucleic acid-binding protein